MALPVIDELPEESVRKRMLANKGIADSLVPCNGKSVSAAWTRACKVLGIKDLRFHDLRHGLLPVWLKTASRFRKCNG